MATLQDVTTGETLASQLEYARGVVSRTRGLMMRRELAPGAGLLIQPCSSIHMMFMRFPIDAVFYDKEQRVTKVARGVRTWTGLAFGGRGAKGVVELPVGAAARVEPGHQLAFDPPIKA